MIMTQRTTSPRAPWLRRAGSAAVAGALALALAGCDTDEILEVETPDVVLPENLVTAQSLPAVLAAGIGDVALAYRGSGGNPESEGQILYSGLLGDEIRISDTFGTRIEIDTREIRDENSNNQDVFRLLERARVSTERAAASYARLDSTAALGRAESLALAGVTYVFFGENYCSGVPFSAVTEEGEFEYGEPETTEQIFRRAVERADSALVIATARNNANLRDLARIVKARAQLNLGQYAAAAATVGAQPAAGTTAAIPAIATTYSYVIGSSENTTRQNNGTWNFNINQRRFSVADREGPNSLPYRTDNDPRVRYFTPGTAVAAGRGFDQTAFSAQLKYPLRASPTVLANGVEARLIEAEAALQANNPTTFLAIHNALRANTALYPCPTGVTYAAYTCTAPTALAPLTAADIATRTAWENVHFKERAYWLWLTSHRLGDMRRLSRTATASLSGYGRGAAAVYPTGAYFKLNLTYGPDTSLPVPIDEANNPNFTACDNVAP